MKKISLAWLLLAMAMTTTGAAEAGFWRQLTPEERRAAGVEQLTPEQQAAFKEKMQATLGRMHAEGALGVTTRPAK